MHVQTSLAPSVSGQSVTAGRLSSRNLVSLTRGESRSEPKHQMGGKKFSLRQQAVKSLISVLWFRFYNPDFKLLHIH